MSKSISCFRLFIGRQGNIRVKTGVDLEIRLHNNLIITMDARTGKVKFDPCGYCIPSTVRAFNRFLELLECKRYYFNLKKENITLTDRKTNNKKLITAREPLFLTIPMKSLVKYYLITGIIPHHMKEDFENKAVEEQVVTTYDEKTIVNRMYTASPSAQDIPF